MSNEVTLSVKSELGRVIGDLQKLQEQADKVGQGLATSGDDVTKEFKGDTKKAEGFLQSLQNLGRRTADQLRRDFKGLFSLEALKSGMNLGNKFGEQIKGTIQLNDSVRRLGRTFGVAENDFAAFQAKLVRGLGEIGAGSEEAARSLEGLSQTQVRGDSNILEYSKTSTELAGAGGQKGSEGDIAKGLADLIRSKGGDQNNVGLMKTMAEDVRRTMNTTGQKPLEAINSMKGLFESMAPESRKQMSTGGLSKLSAVEAVIGPEMKTLVSELTQGRLSKLPKTAQGFGGIIGDKGVDFEKLSKIAGIGGRIGGDRVASFQTAGFSEGAAKALVRLLDQSKIAKAAQEGVGRQTGNVEEQYKGSRGIGDSFQASFNKVGSMVAEPLAEVSQGANKLLGKAADSKLGSALVVGGSGLLAATLAGGGLRGLGSQLLGGGKALAKGALAEQVTGQKTMPVFVVNFSELDKSFGGMMGAGAGGAAGGAGGLAAATGKLSKAADLMQKAASISMAAQLGYDVGKMVEPMVTELLDKSTTEQNDSGFKGNMLERFFFAIDKATGGHMGAGEQTKNNDREKELDKKNADMLAKIERHSAATKEAVQRGNTTKSQAPRITHKTQGSRQ